jgi:hypothetical protein
MAHMRTNNPKKELFKMQAFLTSFDINMRGGHFEICSISLKSMPSHSMDRYGSAILFLPAHRRFD